MIKIGELKIYYNRTEGYWYVISPKDLIHSVGMFGNKEGAIKFCEDLNRKEKGKVIKSWPDV